ncbi:MAG: VWA domain-containing protein [Clostridiales bacterium]|jgi:Ca-activated chloride channel family protein|nr:VWA domain-containing protein [Clostridiales bacterium]
MKTKWKAKITIGFIACLAVALSALAGCSSSSKQLTAEQASQELRALLTTIKTRTVEPQLDIGGIELSDPGAELPDISNYPFSVTGTGSINVEIFASTEKAGPNMDGWINEIAGKFNKEGLKIGGSSVSVSIRPLASGLATDYIVTGTYIPHAFTPSNELWGEMIRAQGIPIEKAAERIAGNTAGILMSKSKANEFTAKYSEITLKNVLDSVCNGELLLGYTNPYSSSTGLNILTALLQSFDSSDPLSDTATEKLELFQSKVPPVAYTTAQMRESAKKGVLDAMIMEYQAYINEPTLRDYVFTPFGVRHDSPVYALNNLSGNEMEALKLFIEYCQSADSQTEAARFGFNGNDNYKGEPLNLSGSQLFTAQSIWKAKKDAGKPVVAVFIADTSGSMEGTPIKELKTSLINASQYINEENYVGLVSYASNVEIDLPIDRFNAQQKAYFTGAVKNLSASGSTATYDAVLVGLDMLLKKQEEIPNAKLLLFVLSDGEQNEGHSLARITSVVKGFGIPIHTIGYNANLDELKKLSEINEASSVNASENDVIYNLKNIFNAQL